MINSEELKAGNSKSAVETNASRENVRRTRYYEKSKMDAALYNSADNWDRAATPVQTPRVDKSPLDN